MLCSFPCAFALLERECRIHFTLATHFLCCGCRFLFIRIAGAPIYAKITIEDNWLLSHKSAVAMEVLLFRWTPNQKKDEFGGKKQTANFRFSVEQMVLRWEPTEWKLREN